MAAPFQNGSTETVTVRPEFDASQNRYVITYNQDPNGLILSVSFAYLNWQPENNIMQLLGFRRLRLYHSGEVFLPYTSRGL